ncbi:MAG: hypothetical protein GEV08_23785 [Acidimicrobiia bacterium]|nr:hypothetical protein [Acidimicrobiia bacterium]
MAAVDVHLVGGAERPVRLVLLHGHGGSPEAMLEAAVALADAVDVQVLLPRGPQAAEDGWAWWPPGTACEPQTVASVRDLVSGPRPTVLAGFSQGGAMALLACARAPGLAAGLAVVCGFVPDDVVDLSGGRAALPPVLVLHGEDDEVVDPMHGRMVARWCERQGQGRVTSALYAGGHDWLPETSAAVAGWVDELGLLRPA